MSIEHSPAKQRRSINIKRQHYTADKQHYTADDLKVLTLKEWAKLTGISFQTAKRLVAAGEGPRIIQLSAKRMGVRMIDAARWSEERLRSA